MANKNDESEVKQYRVLWENECAESGRLVSENFSLRAKVAAAEQRADGAERAVDDLRSTKPFSINGMGVCPKCLDIKWTRYLHKATPYLPEQLSWTCECGYRVLTWTADHE